MRSMRPYMNRIDGEAEPTATKLLAMLRAIPLLKPNAQRLLDRARSILTDGPQLSMNVELTEGQELPTAMHTLLQGTLWAVMMASGANPDLLDQEKQQKASNASKQLWFLCKKTFFTHTVAEMDGRHSSHQTCSTRQYSGRVFIRSHSYRPKDCYYTQLRLPPVMEHFTYDGSTCIYVTPRGIYGTGSGTLLGMLSSVIRVPTRLTFQACPRVTEFEAGLPVWHKNELVTDVTIGRFDTFLLTPVGLVMVGRTVSQYIEDAVDSRVFNTVPCPQGFVPDQIISGGSFKIVTQTDPFRQLISGDNYDGRLGLGHCGSMSGLVDLPFRVYDIYHSSYQDNYFISDRQILFAGEVSGILEKSGLLPSHECGGKCITATPLCFPTAVIRFYVDFNRICWSSISETTCVDRHCGVFTLPFEAIEFSYRDSKPCFMDSSGGWVTVSLEEGAELRRLPDGEGPNDEFKRQVRRVSVDESASVESLPETSELERAFIRNRITFC
ncbi:hypothetical protein J8273_2694 [Carpediemonas membranifera]|uniref:Uncharacterized protein n=1 Tax=Carpediemonas membranifera TaxID=201153 RepID=A0A8J6E5H8_9EUKA|nr:hypothetical protein J8273_2694 [Carpediemonas membranifera]|eukprot:KAG9395782.1 hypothetical protein J8273_2694 [Carpediemonas membranifera]